ncbi:cytosolic phospholipase A2 gamma [Macrotis lagotis]|uniref:cytosolic phospholipase A2 gamma n=1 Tax=Macrotis lagotis TaxID=92651 RepID=UPI003D68AFFB
MTDKPQQAAFTTKSRPGKQNERSDISVHFGISEEEKVAVQNRGKKVLMALQKLGINTKKGPVVSVLVSGGGLRAAIACQGVLTELSHLGILDMVTYIAGVSGSTWCMASLYTQSDDGWKDLWKAECELQRRLRENSWDFFIALNKLCKAAERDDYSLTDFWSHSFVYYLTKELMDFRLSHVKHQSVMGTVPYPIFATISQELKIGEKKNLKAWFEFTPDWAGYSTLGYSEPGAYVSTPHCGSKFEGGKLIKQEPERDFSYLRALCGSALADKDIVVQYIKDFFKKFMDLESMQRSVLIAEPDGINLKDILEELFNLMATFQTDGDCLPSLAKLQHTMSGDKNFDEAAAYVTKLTELLSRTDKDEQRQLFHELLIKTWKKDLMEKSHISSYLNFLWKTICCLLSWTWGTTNNFLYKAEDIEDKHLTGGQNLHLMDAGLAINSAYPLVLPPVRNSDIILSFDFSEGDPFMTITETENYCKSCNIPFPPVDKDRLKQDADAPWDCYVFEGEKGPVVMHFPLFNRVNCGSAGIIKEKWKTYETFRFRDYSDDEVIQLLKDSKLNVNKNKDRILAKISELSKATS